MSARDRFLRLEPGRPLGPEYASGAPASRFEETPAAPEGIRVLDAEAGQPFVRCARCRADNYLTATCCRECGSDLLTPEQKTFNAALWRRLEADRLEQDQAVEALRTRRQQAERDQSEAFRLRPLLEAELERRQVLGLSLDGDGEDVAGDPVGNAARRARVRLAAAIASWLPSRNARLGAAGVAVGLLLALLARFPRLAWVLALAALVLVAVASGYRRTVLEARRRASRAGKLGLALVLCNVSGWPLAAQAEDTWPAPSRLVAVGDVHGDREAFVAVLRAAGIVDEQLHWSAGKDHLVQTGDRVDRGPESRAVMDLLLRLEKEAKKAGGRVHALTGNHEAMNVLGDLRYVTPEEFAAFRGPDSDRLRDALWEQTLAARRGKGEKPTEADRRKFDDDHPLGWVEHRLAFGPKGTYGKWIAGANAVIKVGDTLFLHGGIGPKYADFSLADLNDRIRREVGDPDPLTAVVSQDTDGPLWYRGLAQGGPDLLPHVEAVLARHGVKRIVIGHTPTEGLVLPRFGGRVVQIDVGLSHFYGGPPACLVLEGGQAFALHRGRKLPLPQAEGEPLLAYVREAAALEPNPGRLKPLLDRLEAAVAAPAPSR